MALKNIQQNITMPQPPLYDGDVEAYAEAMQVWTNDYQMFMEDYARTLADNIVEQPRWDDFRVPFTRDKQGQTSKPDFDFTNLGLLFPQNDDAEIVYIINQMPHAMKIGSKIEPHVHFIQTGAALPVFKMDYKIYDNGSTVPSSWTTITSESSGKMSYSSGSMLQIIDFPDIDTSEITGVSGFLDVRFYRDDNVVSGNVLVKEWDFHYEIDSLGSREEYRK